MTSEPPTTAHLYLKIQQYSFKSDGEPQHNAYQQELIDEIVLGPLEKYRKYGRFPWEVLLTVLMILSTTISSQATVQIQYPQQREIQTFFNFHLLAHDSFDIYEGATVFTWRTHQYRTLDDMMEFFNRTLEVLIGLNQLNFYPLNETRHLLTNHTVKRVLRDGNTSVDDYTLPYLAGSGELTVLLKETVVNVRIMQVKFHLYDVSANIQYVDIIIDIEFRQKFMMFVEVNTEFVKTNFTTDHRLFGRGNDKDYNETYHGDNLKIRKLPNDHRYTMDPPRISYLASVLLIGLTIRSMLRRHSMYKKHPTCIDGIANGQQFSSMTLKEKINLLGVWNFLMVGLCVGSFIGGGMATFFCWVQLARYLEYTSNPFLISFLLRKVIIIQAALLLNILIVLTGFVMFSMVVFTATKKFEDVRLAYFEYIFNNFQYGIYENFIALEQYGGFAQLMYYFLLFYMVSCANQMLPSILCGLVISRGRYQDLQEFISGLRMPCPVCKCVTNTSPRKKQGSNELEESKVMLEVASPTLSPFLTPTTEPMRAVKKRFAGFHSKRTMFQINEEVLIRPASNTDRFRLFMQKSYLLMTEFEECMLVLEINREVKHHRMLAQQFVKSQNKLERLYRKLDAKPSSQRSLPDKLPTS